MIQTLSKNILNKLIQKGMLSCKDHDAWDEYHYVIYSFISRLFFMLTILLISLVFSIIFSNFYILIGTICFVATVYILRTYSGGYHAKTSNQCLFLSIGSYFLCLLGIYLTSYIGQRNIIIVENIFSFFLLFCFAPVLGDHDWQSDANLRKMKHLNRFYLILLMVASIILMLFQNQNTTLIAFFISNAMCIVSISVGVQQIKNTIQQRSSK